MRARSLYSQLLVWLLAPLAVIIVVDTLATYASVRDTARLIHEHTLLGSARMIGERLAFDSGELTVAIPPAALELLDTGHGDRAWYRVTSAQGNLLAGSADLPLPSKAVAAESWYGFNATMQGEPVYIVAFAQPIFGSPQSGFVQVEVAQTLRARSALIGKLWSRAMRNQVLMLLLGSVLIWIGLQRGIAPLQAVRERMRAHDLEALEPIEIDKTPVELHPLIATLNEYSARLREHMLTHSRFIADASHQLRTPLAVMNTQVAYGLRAPDVEAKDETLLALRGSLRSHIRLVSQLLSYTEAEGAKPSLLATKPVEIGDVVRHVAEELAMQAQAKEIDFGVESDAATHPVAVSEHALHLIIANLVDNALRYTQAGGSVTVRLSRDGAVECVDVCDNGPGIPVDLRERVFERFVRLNDKEIDGCGLGLAIVREIAAGCGARVLLHDASGGRGLRVSVRFPRFAAEEG